MGTYDEWEALKQKKQEIEKIELCLTVCAYVLLWFFVVLGLIYVRG